MSRKKKEHILFDRMGRIKTNINKKKYIHGRKRHTQNRRTDIHFHSRKRSYFSADWDHIYWIGGSPCSGKSTLAEMLVERYGFTYYRCDDFLEKYTITGARHNIPIMIKFRDMNIDQEWLDRSVDQQINDELEFYRAAFPMILEEVKSIGSGKKIIVEGAALLPENILAAGIPSYRYISIVPTEEFQRKNYSARPWVPGYLAECSDPETAFSNWMERDSGFAKIVTREAQKAGMKLIIEDGESEPAERLKQITKYWNLDLLPHLSYSRTGTEN